MEDVRRTGIESFEDWKRQRRTDEAVIRLIPNEHAAIIYQMFDTRLSFSCLEAASSYDPNIEIYLQRRKQRRYVDDEHVCEPGAGGGGDTS